MNTQSTASRPLEILREWVPPIVFTALLFGLISIVAGFVLTWNVSVRGWDLGQVIGGRVHLRTDVAGNKLTLSWQATSSRFYRDIDWSNQFDKYAGGFHTTMSWVPMNRAGRFENAPFVRYFTLRFENRNLVTFGGGTVMLCAVVSGLFALRSRSAKTRCTSTRGFEVAGKLKGSEEETGGGNGNFSIESGRGRHTRLAGASRGTLTLPSSQN